MRIPRLILILIAAVAVAALLVVTALLSTPAITHYVEGPDFRAIIESETAKSLHFSKCEFEPIHRTGFFTAISGRAKARDGFKAMTSLDAHDITARFDPSGIFLRRWSINDLQVERAEIGVQTYEPVPMPTPSRPWSALFLPERVYLKHVWSDHADVTWKLRGQRAGIFDTHLVITPHGRDFNYMATGGVLRNPLAPQLQIRQIHLLITKTVFALHDMDLASGREGQIHVEGSTGTRGENKNLDFRFDWKRLPLSEWLPGSWANNFKGNANGDLSWTGEDYRLGAAIMNGNVNIADARVVGLKWLDDIATLTNHHDLRRLDLNECRGRARWEKFELLELSDLAIEQHGKFRIEGHINVNHHSLGGQIDLGLTKQYLDWLPHPEEIFPRESGGYLWATVHLSGTLENPQQDLSPRVVEALKQSPAALLTTAIRQLRSWLRGQ